MTLRFENTFESAEAILNRCLSSGQLAFGRFNSELSNLCSLKHFEICNVGRNPDDDSNMTVNLNYVITEVDESKLVRQFDKARQLNFLCTMGDTEWTYNMIVKVWDGNYPSTIAYDTTSGEIFLAYIQPWGLELKYFATLTKEQFTALADLNLKYPFKIAIRPAAMFKVIDGSEGTNYLKSNLYISLDCIQPIEVNIQAAVDKVY